MLKSAAATFLVCVSIAICLSCGSTANNFLYATLPGSNQIVAYREDPNSGILTQLSGSPISAGQAVQSVVIHPSKKFLYTANTGENDVSQYLISSVGVLTELPPRTSVGTAPTLLAMDSAGSFLYVANSGSYNISVFSIDATTGALKPVGSPFPIGMIPISMALSSGGGLYITGQGTTGVATSGIIQAFTVSQGIPTVVAGSPYLTGRGPYGLAIAPGGGFLYTANTLDNSISIFPINSDGSLGQANTIGQQYSNPIALLIDKSGKYMYVANQGSSNLSGFSIGSDGGLTLLSTSPFATASGPSVLATDSLGKYVFVGNQKSPAIQSFFLDSGTLSSVASYPISGGSNPISIAVTP